MTFAVIAMFFFGFCGLAGLRLINLKEKCVISVFGIVVLSVR